MALKHLTRLAAGRADPSDLRFIDDDGAELHLLVSFHGHLRSRGYSVGTRKRYMEAAARFVDYLIECDVFRRPARPIAIAEAINAYPIFLRDGAGTDWPELPTLPDYAQEIGFADGLAANSFTPVLAAVNQLLRFGKDEALRAAAAFDDHGMQVEWDDLRTAFAAIEGSERWSRAEKDRLRQQTLLGGVIRLREELQRPRGLRSPVRGGVQVDLVNKEFPFERLGDLLDAALSARDRTLWALLAGGGLRLHEALNLRFSDVDPRTGEVWIVDPDNHRFGQAMQERDRLRFKGRAMSKVYLFEPLRTAFWAALKDYLDTEFVGTSDPSNDFLFRKIDGGGRGDALVGASDTAIEKQFKAAVRRARVPGPREAPDHLWTPHSLRHCYGVYMLNYIPVPGGPGLRLTEVQALMGHARIESTAIYARHDQLLLEAKIEAADMALFDAGSTFDGNLSEFPHAIADRLRTLADSIAAGDRMAG